MALFLAPVSHCPVPVAHLRQPTSTATPTRHAVSRPSVSPPVLRQGTAADHGALQCQHFQESLSLSSLSHFYRNIFPQFLVSFYNLLKGWVFYSQLLIGFEDVLGVRMRRRLIALHCCSRLRNSSIDTAFLILALTAGFWSHSPSLYACLCVYTCAFGFRNFQLIGLYWHVLSCIRTIEFVHSRTRYRLHLMPLSLVRVFVFIVLAL